MPEADFPTWSPEWPIEPGHYWFFGWLDKGDRRANEPCLYNAKVDLAQKDPMYIVGGQFMWKSDGAKGFWIKAFVPRTDGIMSSDLFKGGKSCV